MGELIQPNRLIILFIVFCLFLFVVSAVIAMVRASGRHSVGLRQSIVSVVPRPAKILAASLLCIAVTAGVIAGSLALRTGDHTHAPILGGLLGLAAGTFIGSLFTFWVLCLGYVYGDARHRNMPPVLWTLVALLVPNLLGFLLYFVLRKPLGRPCPQCGQAITPEQRFCSWCGWQQYSAPYPTTVTPPGPTGLDPSATG